MSVLKALSNIKLRRGMQWDDWRPRSPKSLGDMSGVLTPRVGAHGFQGLQDFDYDMLSKIYVCNDLAWTCIDLVSSTAGQGKLKARIREGDQITYVPDHPLQSLLDFPNGSMTQFDLIQSYVTHQKLYGTVAVLLLRQSMMKSCPVCLEDSKDECLHRLYLNIDGPIEQMMPVHPDNIMQDYIEVDGKKRKIFFFVPEPNRKFPIHPNNILTDPYYNPTIGWYGVSPTFILKRWLDLDTSMTSQVKELFDNGAIPSMIVSMKPGTNFTYEQEPETLVEMMKEKWMSQFSSKGNSKKAPAFVYGDINVERLQDKIEESIAKGLYYEIQGRVCATYGVPPTLYEMGLKYGSQRASAEQAEKDFFNRTISKILIRIENKVNKLIVPSFKTPGLEVAWDLTTMPVADFLVKQNKDAVKKDWELGLISRDTARVMLGYKAIGGELGDDFYRLTVMSDGSNTNQVAGMDNRLKLPATNESSSSVTSAANK